MKKSTIVISFVLLASATGLLMYQQHAIRGLRAENMRMRETVDRVKQTASESASANASSSNSELERLRLEHSELLRLRNETARLRNQLAEARNKSASTPPSAASEPVEPTKEPERSPEPFDTFVASADAVVPRDHALVFGGWATAPGKRTLVLVEPKVIELSRPGYVGSILLQGKFIEVPDEALRSLGLEKLRAETRAASIQTLLSADQIKSTIAALEAFPGATVLSRPRIQTGDGVQASLRVTEQKTVAGQEQAVGPSLDVDPRIASDGSSVNLTVVARLKKAAESFAGTQGSP